MHKTLYNISRGGKYPLLPMPAGAHAEVAGRPGLQSSNGILESFVAYLWVHSYPWLIIGVHSRLTVVNPYHESFIQWFRFCRPVFELLVRPRVLCAYGWLRRWL